MAIQLGSNLLTGSGSTGGGFPRQVRYGTPNGRFGVDFTNQIYHDTSRNVDLTGLGTGDVEANFRVGVPNNTAVTAAAFPATLNNLHFDAVGQAAHNNSFTLPENYLKGWTFTILTADGNNPQVIIDSHDETIIPSGTLGTIDVMIAAGTRATTTAQNNTLQGCVPGEFFYVNPMRDLGITDDSGVLGALAVGGGSRNGSVDQGSQGGHIYSGYFPLGSASTDIAIAVGKGAKHPGGGNPGTTQTHSQVISQGGGASSASGSNASGWGGFIHNNAVVANFDETATPTLSNGTVTTYLPAGPGVGGYGPGGSPSDLNLFQIGGVTSTNNVIGSGGNAVIDGGDGIVILYYYT